MQLAASQANTLKWSAWYPGGTEGSEISIAFVPAGSVIDPTGEGGDFRVDHFRQVARSRLALLGSELRFMLNAGLNERLHSRNGFIARDHSRLAHGEKIVRRGFVNLLCLGRVDARAAASAADKLRQ